jgi:hypothetical protein
LGVDKLHYGTTERDFGRYESDKLNLKEVKDALAIVIDVEMERAVCAKHHCHHT